jgi:hypothetical protein
MKGIRIRLTFSMIQELSNFITYLGRWRVRTRGGGQGAARSLLLLLLFLLRMYAALSLVSKQYGYTVPGL